LTASKKERVIPPRSDKWVQRENKCLKKVLGTLFANSRWRGLWGDRTGGFNRGEEKNQVKEKKKKGRRIFRDFTEKKKDDFSLEIPGI